MSNKRLPSWASVVVNGIHDDAVDKKDQIEAMPSSTPTSSKPTMPLESSKSLLSSSKLSSSPSSLSSSLAPSSSSSLLLPPPMMPSKGVKDSQLDEQKVEQSQKASNKRSVPDQMASSEAKHQDRRDCLSPRARTRCQITSETRSFDLMQWQPIGKSRQLWQPHDPHRRGRDPSNPKPSPPPGFEHIELGRQAISSRARQLMGENVDKEMTCDYPTPETMPRPERQLREQKHFIAKHDTHLTCGQAQLKVINGGTEDGYYVRPLAKLLPQFTKLTVTPKYKYWELLRRFRDINNRETSSKDKKMTNISNSLSSTSSDNSQDITAPMTDKKSPDEESEDPQNNSDIK